MESKVYAIVNRSHPAWYCATCKQEHKVLFKNGRRSYCYRCAPHEVVEVAEWVNQIGEPVERIEEEQCST